MFDEQDVTRYCRYAADCVSVDVSVGMHHCPHCDVMVLAGVDPSIRCGMDAFEDCGCDAPEVEPRRVCDYHQGWLDACDWFKVGQSRNFTISGGV